MSGSRRTSRRNVVLLTAGLVAVLGAGAAVAVPAMLGDRVERGPVVAGAATIDRATGHVVRPSDTYLLTPEEHRTVLAAHTLAMGRCAERLDIPYDTGLPDQEPVPEITDAQMEVLLAECVHDPSVEKFEEATGTGPWTDDLMAAEDGFLESDEFDGIVDEWTRCIEDHGFDDSDVRLGEFDVITHTMSTTGDPASAAALSACTKDVDMAQRLGDLHAAYDAPVIERWRTELDDLRRFNDQQYEAAQDLMRSAGGAG